MIVVLHGGPAATHDYLVPEWTILASVARVVFFDQRGCGEAPKRGPYSWRQLARDLDTLIAQLAGGPVFVAGSSWGAQLALLYAYHHPERVHGLILSGLPQWPDAARMTASWQSPLMARIRSTMEALDSNRTFPRVARRDSHALGPARRLLKRLRFCDDVGANIHMSLRGAPELHELR